MAIFIQFEVKFPILPTSFYEWICGAAFKMVFFKRSVCYKSAYFFGKFDEKTFSVSKSLGENAFGKPQNEFTVKGKQCTGCTCMW